MLNKILRKFRKPIIVKERYQLIDKEQSPIRIDEDISKKINRDVIVLGNTVQVESK